MAINKKRRIEERIDATEDDIVNLDVESVDFIDMKAWGLLTDAAGTQFKSFRQFCEAPRPHGLGCNERQFKILLAAYERSKTQIVAEMAQPQPTLPEAMKGNKNATKNSGNNSNYCFDIPSIRGNDPKYLTSVIARDRPDILERMKAGDYRSVRSAAIDAGIVDPEKSKRYSLPADPTSAARYLLARVDPGWVATFVDELVKAV